MKVAQITFIVLSAMCGCSTVTMVRQMAPSEIESTNSSFSLNPPPLLRDAGLQTSRNSAFPRNTLSANLLHKGQKLLEIRDENSSDKCFWGIGVLIPFVPLIPWPFDLCWDLPDRSQTQVTLALSAQDETTQVTIATNDLILRDQKSGTEYRPISLKSTFYSIPWSEIRLCNNMGNPLYRRDAPCFQEVTITFGRPYHYGAGYTVKLNSLKVDDTQLGPLSIEFARSIGIDNTGISPN